MVLAACSGVERGHYRSEFRDLQEWSEDRHSAALPALVESCRAFATTGDDMPVVYPGYEGRVADWRPICAALASLPAGDDLAARSFFENWFIPVAVADPQADDGRIGLFTGYYIPNLQGSFTRTARYRVPVYSKPSGRLASLPREEIERGALSGRGLEILWVDDPIDLFFMHIQGSGRVSLPDGSTVTLGYAGTNGHRYFAVGRLLVDWGYSTPEDMSMAFIRDWMQAHPRRAQALMNLNPSYVYFTILKGDAVGALGRPLTPGRSLAIDRRTWSLGYPFWVELDGVPSNAAPDGLGSMHRLMVAQDTGDAIRGRVRGDVFWGYGAMAGNLAGRMRAKGRYWALVPKTVVDRAETAAAEQLPVSDGQTASSVRSSGLEYEPR